MDEFDAHGMKAVFFVNVYEAGDALPQWKTYVEDTMQEIIESIQTNNPGILAKKIMERVMLFTGGKAKDDMTVLAACIWEK